jgi:sulfonate transport system ATP-binding protein
MSSPRPSSAVVSSDVVVEVVGLRRAFGSRLVLDDVDLTIRRGEFVALVGRSGGGKTTLLRSLDGLDPPQGGRVRVPTARAVVFQEPRLLPWKKVAANVCLGLRGSDGRTRALAALAEVGLAERADAWPLTLSGGEAQRASLARALVREPDLLLLDEPFGALDALTRLNMHALVLELHRRHLPATLLVTHDVDEALILADRILVLEGGRIIEVPVHLGRPRWRADPAIEQARVDLLQRLGVTRDQLGVSDRPATSVG